MRIAVEALRWSLSSGGLKGRPGGHTASRLWGLTAVPWGIGTNSPSRGGRTLVPILPEPHVTQRFFLPRLSFQVLPELYGP